MYKNIEEIKKIIKSEFNSFAPNPMMEKATNYIMGLGDNNFWVEEAAPYIGNAISLVMEFTRTGILINGSTGNKIAKMSQETGEITVSTRS